MILSSSVVFPSSFALSLTGLLEEDCAGVGMETWRSCEWLDMAESQDDWDGDPLFKLLVLCGNGVDRDPDKGTESAPLAVGSISATMQLDIW